MKRIIPFCLALLLTFSLICIPALAADSGEDDSGSMVLSGVTQSLTAMTSATVDDGYIYYNGVLVEKLPVVSGCPYFIIASKPTTFVDAYFSSVPFVVSSSDSDLQLYPASKTTVTVKRYMYNPISKKWAFYRDEKSFFGSWGGGVVYTPFYSNHDICIWNTSSGLTNTVKFSAGTASTEGMFSTTLGYSNSIESFRFENGEALGVGAQKENSIFSDLTFSFSASDPYVDINLPLSMWSDSIPAEYDGITIDGDVLFDFALGLTLWLEDFSGGKYIISDLLPSTFQLLINGDLCEDMTQYSFAESARANAGSVFSEYQSFDLIETGSISTGEIAVDQIDTLGFRIYLSSASGGASKTFTNDSTFSLSWPYVYANFAQSDGSLGLPSVTFSEVEVVDPDPEPSVSPDPDPEPSVSPDPDPEPSVSPNPDPEPSVSPNPDPEPSVSPNPDPEPSVSPDLDPEPDDGKLSILDKLGQFFDNLSIPTEVMKVFEGFADVWGAIPITLRYVLISMFSIACLLAVIKMLF